MAKAAITGSKKTPQKANKDEEGAVSPLERYIRILEVIAVGSGRVTLAEIARTLKLPKTTVNRLVDNLRESQVINGSNIRGGHLALAPRLLRCLHSANTEQREQSLVELPLSELANITGQTAFLAKLRGHEVFTVAMQAPQHASVLNVVPGIRMAPHSSASGRAILCHQDLELVMKALVSERNSPSAAGPPITEKVLAEYADIQHKGFSTSFAEEGEPFWGVAVPVRLPSVGVIYSVGVTGAGASVEDDKVNFYIKKLHLAAGMIEKALQVGSPSQYVLGR